MRTCKDIFRPVIFGVLTAGFAAPAFCQSSGTIDPSTYYDPLRPMQGAIQSTLMADPDGEASSFNDGINLSGESGDKRVQFGLQREQKFVVNGRAPLQLIYEEIAGSGTAAADLHRNIIGTSDLVFERTNERLADPAIAETVSSVWRDAVLTAQARYLSDMHRRDKYRNTKFEQLLGQTDEGCLANILKTAGTTYAEAQEKCYQSKLNLTPTKLKYDDLTGSMDNAVQFKDFPGKEGIDDAVWNQPDSRKIRMTDIIFSPEIMGHRGSDELGTGGDTVVIRLREAWKGLIGDYEWTLETGVGGSVKLTDKRIPPTGKTDDERKGFDAIQSILFKQVYHGIYAMEYAHCLVAKGEGGVPFPSSGGAAGGTPVSEAEFFTRRGVGNPASTTYWPPDAAWDNYGADAVVNKPLKLYKMRFPELAASLSVGPAASTVSDPGFSFNGQFESALWALFRKNILSDTLQCDILKSWSGEAKIPRKDWKLQDQLNFDREVIDLASLISTAQVLGFLDQSLDLINKISNKVLDERMASNARDMIYEFANYVPVTDYFLRATNMTRMKADEIILRAEQVRKGQGITQGAGKQNDKK